MESAMTRIPISFGLRFLGTVTAIALIGTSMTGAAEAISLGGGIGSGGIGGSVGASAGGGSGVGGNASVGDGSGTAAKGNLSLGGRRSNGNFNLGSGDTSVGISFGSAGLTPGSLLDGSRTRAIRTAIDDLSIDQRRKLAKKCVSVLAAPNRFTRDTVLVCKVVASL